MRLIMDEHENVVLSPENEYDHYVLGVMGTKIKTEFSWRKIEGSKRMNKAVIGIRQLLFFFEEAS